MTRFPALLALLVPALPHGHLGGVAAARRALGGTLLSICLTVLEPFVIGATCMWCVTSAVLMTLVLWASTPAPVKAWRKSLPRVSRRRLEPRVVSRQRRVVRSQVMTPPGDQNRTRSRVHDV